MGRIYDHIKAVGLTLGKFPDKYTHILYEFHSIIVYSLLFVVYYVDC